MKLQTDFETKRARIEMIPLMDCIFLLLIFFIYIMISMTLNRGIKVDLPSAVTSAISREDYISITVDKKNRVYLNKKEVRIKDLLSEIEAISSGMPTKPILINGDKESDLGMAITILDLLRSRGIHEVSIQCTKD